MAYWKPTGIRLGVEYFIHSQHYTAMTPGQTSYTAVSVVLEPTVQVAGEGEWEP